MQVETCLTFFPADKLLVMENPFMLKTTHDITKHF